MSLSQRAYLTLTRKKFVDLTKSNLAKVLTLLDLTALGIGSTLGVGVYVLAGEVAKTTAGPAVVISFIIAAIASVFAGLCYAEFGARVPKAGSAYVYSYVTIGEFVAFLIGWNLVLEYAIGSASVVKGLSTYLDALLGYPMRDFFTETMPFSASALGEYPDFFALGVTLLFALGLALGAKESTTMNNIFTMTNLSVVLYVIITGSFKADPANWTIPLENIPEDADAGTGGFAPFGINGIIKGAAICFYGFVGFDCIATAGEEARDPKRSIPLSIIISLSVITVAYISVSTVLTMMLPYYEQDPNAPLPHVFRVYGWYVAEYIVSIGAMFGLCASLMGAMFPLPRVIYAMAIDGLMFKIMGYIHPRFKTPFVGTLIAGSLTGILAAIFNLSQLVSMMSIGTLMAYSMVAACVLLLRYELDESDIPLAEEIYFQEQNFFKRILNTRKLNTPTKETATLVTNLTSLFCLFSILFSCVVIFLSDQIQNAEWYAILMLVVFGATLIGSVLIIWRQPPSSAELSFKVPFLPLLPCLSIFINIYLMIMLDYMTWIRFIVWIAIGLAIYFFYGVWNSKERPKNKLEAMPIMQSNDTSAEDITTTIINNNEIDDNQNEKKQS